MMKTTLAVLALAAAANAQICNSIDHGSTSFPGADPGATTFVFLIVMGSLVMFMQAGFAMVEAGSIGVTSVVSVLFKNLGDMLFGAIAWFIFGWAWAYGTTYYDQDHEEPTTSTQWFIGDGGYFLQNVNPCYYPLWFYQWTFAATAATIVSGAMSGRTKLQAYLLFTVFMTAWVYPTIVHWTWSTRAWLRQGSIDDSNAGTGYYDYAGSGVVHCTGGMAALVGAYFVGPRGTRDFTRDGLAPMENLKDRSLIHGHSMPLVALGTIILFFGFIGFNGGSVLTMETTMSGVVMSLAVVNTVLAAAGGGTAAVLVHFLFKERYWSLLQMCNGTIAGMVAICAGADTVYPWAALVIGFIGGVVYQFWSSVIKRSGIDDPIDAFAVHWGAGAWGVVAVTLFAMDRESTIGNARYGMGGIFYDAFDRLPWIRLGWALLAIIVISGWTAANMGLLFFVLKTTNRLRVDDDEIAGVGGLDKAAHGEFAYVLEPTRAPVGSAQALTPTTGRKGQPAGDVAVNVAVNVEPASPPVKTSQI